MTDNHKMAGVCLLAFIAGLLLEVYGLPAQIPQDSAGAVFVSQQTADTVLRRLRRYNSGHLEELQKDNLERECREEICTHEEAREVFEDNDKLMAFWVTYVDGDQCKPPPCRNGGLCEDGIGSYVCFCKPTFSGKNCEMEVYKQCSINNGGCAHFCLMKADVPICHCAAGYILGPDRRSCQPAEQFSCGVVNVSSTASSRTLLTPRSSNTIRSSDAFNDSLYEDYDGLADLSDYFYDIDTNDSHTSNSSVTLLSRPVRSDSSSSVNPLEVDGNTEVSGVTEAPTDKNRQPSWAFPTLRTVVAEENTDERIVGGNDAIPGEIPWQVALMSYSASLQRAVPFCGGSLLSEFWVITAAHCLNTARNRNFFVRVGEHDVTQSEGPERDHQVAEQHLHFLYDAEKSEYNHDIALLKLVQPVELSNQRRPICLGPKDSIEKLLRESSLSLVSGWGHTQFGGIQANKLQKLEVPHVDRTLCKESSRYRITRFMFCAGYRNEKMDSCKGDSGGPHVTNFKGTWFLTGIVSWGEDCAKEGKYGIYTRVSRYYQWISQKTGLHIT